MSRFKKLKASPASLQSYEYWQKILRRQCPKCSGVGDGFIRHSDSSGEQCECQKMVPYFLKMYSKYGLNEKYIPYNSLERLSDFLNAESVGALTSYIKSDLRSKTNTMFRDAVIIGNKSTNKGRVVGVIYKELMWRYFDVSVIPFSTIVKLSKFYNENKESYNALNDFQSLLEDEDFIIIEDVDNRLMSERLSYDLLDEIFGNRAKDSGKATIITCDSSVLITESTLGQSFYNKIYNGEARQKVSVKIKLTSKFAKNNSVNLEGVIA